VVVEQFSAQAAVEAFDLAGRRRSAGPGQAVGDAVLSADSVEEDLTCSGVAEPSGELFAIVGEHFVRDPVPG